jgi:hypothetical protein
MPTDPKWKTIARVSKQPIALVQATYLHLLVTASRNVTRGHADVTTEDLASALDVTDNEIEAVLSAMQGRVLDGQLLTGWETRQPKREDSGNGESGAKSSAERKAEQRAREKTIADAAVAGADVTDCHAVSRNVTLDKDKDKDKESFTKDKSFVVPYEKITSAYDKSCPMLPAIAKLTDKRKKLIKSCWQFFLDEKNINPSTEKPWAVDMETGLIIFNKFFEAVGKSDFLSGRTFDKDGKPFTGCGIEWLMTEKNFLKVLEGNYKNKEVQA